MEKEGVPRLRMVKKHRRGAALFLLSFSRGLFNPALQFL